jgi:hypothetical protein
MDTSSLPEQPLFLRSDVVATVIEGGAVLLDLQSKFFYSANDSAWAILQLFEAGATLSQVRTQTAAWRGDATPAAGVDSLLALLIAEGLLTGDGTSLPSDNIHPEGEWRPPELEKHREPLYRIMTSAFDPTLPLAE